MVNKDDFPAFDPTAQLEYDVVEQVYMLAGFWIESALYGVYFVLFCGFVRHAMKRSPDSANQSGRILFLVLISTMFVLTTYWEGVNLYRFLEAYAFLEAPGGLPIYYFRFFSRWDNFSYVIVSSFLFWIGDFLAIYRCWIIWDKRYRVVALPFLVLIASIGTNGVNFHFFLYGFKSGLPFRTVKALLDFVYPGHLAQNVLTTSLIAYKIWQRHTESMAAGVRVTSSVTLFTVARIVVESAMIYTLQMAALVVLHFLVHPLRVVFQAAVVPSIGIVFVLVTVRIQRRVKESARRSLRTSVLFPAWAHASVMEDQSGAFPSPVSPSQIRYGTGRRSGESHSSQRSMSMVSILRPSVVVTRDQFQPQSLPKAVSIKSIQRF